MSPLASAIVLPSSPARISASSSLYFAIRSRNFIKTRARRCELTAAQPSCAALAFSTAARISALEASATLARTVPSIGWKTSLLRPDLPATCLPPMKCPYSIIAFSRFPEGRRPVSQGYALGLLAQQSPVSRFTRAELGYRRRHGLGQRPYFSRRRPRRAVRRRRQTAASRSRYRQPPCRGAGGGARRQTVRPPHHRGAADQRRRAFPCRRRTDGKRVPARAGRSLQPRRRTR